MALEQPLSSFQGINQRGINQDGAKPRGVLGAPALQGSFSYDANLTGIVRPFVKVGVQPQSVELPRRLLPGEGTEAFISWGKEADFTFQPPPDVPFIDPTQTGGGGITVNWPDEDEEEEEPQPEPDTVYTEVAERRQYYPAKKIYNPDDDEQWVEVKDIKEATFTSNKDSIVRVFRFHRAADDD